MFREGGGMLDLIKGSDSVLQILGNVALRLSIYITSYILHLYNMIYLQGTSKETDEKFNVFRYNQIGRAHV